MGLELTAACSPGFRSVLLTCSANSAMLMLILSGVLPNAWHSCHEFAVLRWSLGCQNCRLDNCLQFPYNLCPWICVGRDQSILHLLSYLGLLCLSLHFLSHTLDLSLQSNILCICLRIWIHHSHHFWWWRWRWVIWRSLIIGGRVGCLVHRNWTP